jgi:putative transcriptional regulator
VKEVRFKLHELMGKHKIKSINKLSNLTGITRPTLTKIYENDLTRIDFGTIQTLCTFFDCDIEELMTMEEVKENSKPQDNQ